jgi:uncharacterized Zn-finger protein
MDLKRLSNNNWLYRAVLATWIASAIIVTLLLIRIDTIVNVDLYKHGLQFSHDWANPYWTYLRLNFIVLGVPAALSLFAVAVGFIPKSKIAAENVAEPQPKLQPVAIQEQKCGENSCNNTALSGASKPSVADVSCTNCGKTFGRPVVMLDFSGGRSRLLDVCPYCNHVLGSTESGKPSEIDAQVAPVDEKLTP